MGLGGILGAVGGIAQASAASKAAKAQENAANRQIDLQKEIYDDQTQRFAPYLGAGTNALAALQYELGLGPKPTANNYSISEVVDPNGGGSWVTQEINGGDRTQQVWQQGGSPKTTYQVGGQTFDTRDEAQSWLDQNQGFDYQGFQATPGYDFRVQQGVNALDNSAASRGQLFSGNTAKALTDYGQNMASAEYGTFLDRLTGAAGAGQSAAGMQAAAGQNYATGASNALANLGNAQSAGAIGVGNAISGGINNGVGIWQYQNALNSGNTNNTNASAKPSWWPF